MPITVKETLKLGRFSECEVISGHSGLTNQVESITIMENLDVSVWMRNNELLITSLYALKKDDESAVYKLMHELKRSGASALAVKPSKSIGRIPEIMVEESDKLSIPIIYMPESVHFLDVLNPVLHRIFSDKVVLQEDVDLATATLEDILLGGKGMTEFIKKLEMILQNFVTVESEITDFSHQMNNNEIESLTHEEILELYNVRRPVEMIRHLDGRAVLCLISPIIIEEKYIGNISVWDIDDTLLTFDIAVIEKATRMLSLELLKLTIEQDIKMKHENDYIRELLFSSEATRKDFHDFGKMFNINNNQEYFCIVISFDHSPDVKSEKYKANDNNVYAFFKREDQNLLVGKINDTFCLIRLKSEESSNKLKSDFQYLQQIFPVKAVGVGDTSKGFSGIKKSYRQAVYALKFSKMDIESKRVIFYKELGAYVLLDLLKDEKELWIFYQNIFGNLLEDKNAEGLLLTLSEFFNCNGSLKETAQNLFIHINTLKYRIKKIESLTGNNLRSSEGHFNLLLALKIHSML